MGTALLQLLLVFLLPMKGERVFIPCGNILVLNPGQGAHSGVLKSGLSAGGVRHSLITMYSECGELGSARKVFDEISDDLVMI